MPRPLAFLAACWLVALHTVQAAPKTAKDVFHFTETLLFQDDFRSGSLASWNLSEDDRYDLPTNTPERLQIVEAPGLPAGSKAVRSFVPRAPNSFRAEVSLPYEKGFHERWYAERILVPKEWVIERQAKGNDIVLQWHGIPGNWKATYPHLEISVGGDRWFIRRSFGSARAPTRQSITLGGIKPGEWVSWVVHAKWSSGEDGLLQVWQDGKPVLEAKGANVYADVGVEYTPYLKTGIYHPEWNLNTDRKRAAFEAEKADATQKVIYVTDVKIGSESAQYGDVAPR